jgi:hypothetical protein
MTPTPEPAPVVAPDKPLSDPTHVATAKALDEAQRAVEAGGGQAMLFGAAEQLHALAMSTPGQLGRDLARLALTVSNAARLDAPSAPVVNELYLAHGIIAVMINMVPTERFGEMTRKLAEIHDGLGAVRFDEREAALRSCGRKP